LSYVTESILNSVKKVLGVASDVTHFDLDIMMHINTTFSTLNQLGIGPDEGYMIEDSSASWDAFLGSDPRLNNVKTYVYLRVRTLFDQPQTSFLNDAMKKQIEELEWRLNVYREGTMWTDPTLTTAL